MKDELVTLKVNLIKSTCNERDTLISNLKKKIDYQEYIKLINILKNNYHYKNYFKNELFPTQLNRIITPHSIPMIPWQKKKNSEAIITKEIFWFIAFFETFKKDLEQFQSLRKRFEKDLFLGQYTVAEETLKEIEKIFGQSFWLIESKLLLWNYNQSIADTEFLYQEIKNSCEIPFIKIYIRTIRRRTNIREQIQDTANFINKKYHTLQDNNESPSKIIYYYFNHLEINNIKIQDFYYLLHMASQLNLIDMFLLINKIIEKVIIQNDFCEITKEAVVKKIAKSSIEYSCSKSCYVLANGMSTDTNTQFVYYAKELLNKRLYDECAAYCNDALKTHPTNFDLLLTLAKTNVLKLSDNKYDDYLDSPLNSIYKIIHITLLKEINYNDFLPFREAALRFVYMYSSTTFTYHYQNFYYDNFCADNSFVKLSILTCDYYNQNVFSVCNFTTKAVNDSNSSGNIYDSDWTHNPIILENVMYDEISQNLCNINNLDCSVLENIFYYGINSLTDNENKILKNRCSEKLFIAYIADKKFSLAIRLYNNLQFESKLKVVNFRVEQLNNAINPLQIEQLYDDIDFCIYAHLTNFKGVKGLVTNKWVANSLSKILENNNVTVPSQLTIDQLTIDNNIKFCYFVRHVCTKELLRRCLSTQDFEDMTENDRLKCILMERKKLLTIAKQLDNENEIPQINSQIENIDKNINNIENSGFGEFSITPAKILEESLHVSDTEVALPFFNAIKDINLINNINFQSNKTGDYLLFRDNFVRFKKAYLENLNDQIGINIRHGFFANEIIKYFSKYELLIKRANHNEITIVEFFQKKQKEYLVDYAQNIWLFSTKLYAFIENELQRMEIHSVSVPTTDAHGFFVEDVEIQNIAKSISNIKEPYKMRDQMISNFNRLAKCNLLTIGANLGKDIENNCLKYLNESFPEIISNSLLRQQIYAAKANLKSLSNKISSWFDFIKEEDKDYSLSRYLEDIKAKNPELSYSLSGYNHNDLKIKQLYCLDFICNNLISNAREHSGYLNCDSLSMNLSININKESAMMIVFKNTLKNKNRKEMIQCISNIKKNLRTFNTLKHSELKSHIEPNSKGNGYRYIAQHLTTLAKKWHIDFNEDLLPNFFSVSIKIVWG